MALAVVLSSLGRVEAHDPLLRYGALLELHASINEFSHNHSHDDETDMGLHGNGTHKHGFVDHSHEATGPLVNRLPTIPFPPQIYQTRMVDFRLGHKPLRLDRPPKLILHS